MSETGLLTLDSALMKTTDSILSKAEVEELTGYKLAKYQSRWLSENGITHFTNAEGVVKITWWAVNHPRSAISSNEPDFSRVA